MKMNRNNWLKSGFALLGITGLITLLALPASAQERTRTYQLYNTAMGTGYYAAGGTNVQGMNGLVTYAGGTNNVTLTNGQSIYNPSTAAPIPPTPMSIRAQVAGSGTPKGLTPWKVPRWTSPPWL